jgi:hypothetical protein
VVNPCESGLLLWKRKREEMPDKIIGRMEPGGGNVESAPLGFSLSGMG